VETLEIHNFEMTTRNAAVRVKVLTRPWVVPSLWCIAAANLASLRSLAFRLWLGSPKSRSLQARPSDGDCGPVTARVTVGRSHAGPAALRQGTAGVKEAARYPDQRPTLVRVPSRVRVRVPAIPRAGCRTEFSCFAASESLSVAQTVTARGAE